MVGLFPDNARGMYSVVTMPLEPIHDDNRLSRGAQQIGLFEKTLTID